MTGYRRTKRSITFRKKAADKLFDPEQKNLNYIVDDKDLLKKHLKYIDKLAYVPSKLKVMHCTASDGTVIRIRTFTSFRERYKPIFLRWLELVCSCYDPTNSHYKCFGEKGIKLSKEFLDSKFFCKWCLQQKLVDKYGSYTRYLIRRDKSKDYSPENCFTITEKELYESKSLNVALMNIFLAKKYEEDHHKSVSFITARTRYYVFDLSIEDSLNMEYIPSTGDVAIHNMCFSPQEFYRSVADENSVPKNTFFTRIKYVYLSRLTMRPYEMLKPEFDIGKFANSENKLSYAQQYYREVVKNQKDKIYNKVDDPISHNDENSVYNNTDDLNVYS